MGMKKAQQGAEAARRRKKKTDESDGVRRVWDCNAGYWDEKMGEGNDFVNILIWPAVERLLKLEKGARFLLIHEIRIPDRDFRFLPVTIYLPPSL